MSAAAIPYRNYELPWSPSEETERRFRRILRNLLGGLAMAGILMPFLPVPEQVEQAPVIPERIVRLVIEQPKPVPPPPPVVREQERPEPKPEPKVAETRPKPVPVPKVEPVPVDRTRQARERAARSGLLAFADELADLRDDRKVNQITGARAATGNVGDAPVVERSLLTARSGSGSGGINTAALSRNTGGAGLAGREVTRVASVPVAGARPGDDTTTSDNRAARSREEIELVFDQNKGAIFALYNRALRTNPALQGKLVLRLTIEPDGVVSDCSIVSSELNDPELERKLVARVKMFRFEARDVPPVTTTKPIDFFPA